MCQPISASKSRWVSIPPHGIWLKIRYLLYHRDGGVHDAYMQHAQNKLEPFFPFDKALILGNDLSALSERDLGLLLVVCAGLLRPKVTPSRLLANHSASCVERALAQRLGSAYLTLRAQVSPS